MKNKRYRIIVLGFLGAVLFSMNLLAEASENQNEFPKVYQAEKDNVVFDCTVVVDDTVLENGANRMECGGVIYARTDVALELFAEGKEIAEQHETPGTKGEPDSLSIIYKDGSQINLGRTFCYMASDWRFYTDIGVTSDMWENALQEIFDFSAPEVCMDEMKSWTEQLGIPSVEFRYYWYSVSPEELKAQEELLVSQGLVETERVKENWNDEDATYVIYAWQYEQGMPVFHEGMGMYQQFALDDVDSSPVSATWSAHGLVSFGILPFCYELTETEEPVQFLDFESVARVVEEKYNSLLTTDTQYVVKRAKLFWMVSRDAELQWDVEPIWRFETDGGVRKVLVTLVHAETGEEIPLP